MTDHIKNDFIAVGCSGFSYMSWRGNFYTWEIQYLEMLAHYASRFRTLEINGTSYGFLRPETLERWLTQVPKDFLFSIKVPALILRERSVEDRAKAWALFLQMMKPLSDQDRVSAILIQLPTAIEKDMDLLRSLVDAPLEKVADIVFEFQHPSWFHDVPLDFLADHGYDAACVSRPDGVPCYDVLGKYKYFRLNGEKREGSSDYSFKELLKWGERILEAKKSAERVYVYFNNTRKGCAPINAKALVQHVLKLSSKNDQNCCS